MEELAKQYDPRTTEDAWFAFWMEKGLYGASPDPAKKPFTIMIPPPNVTGILHMGHALNNTIQDILIRHHRMLGEEALWMPGTDHAGIATQNVVEKKLAKQGLRRHDLGREKFVEEVWKWKEDHGSTIIRQLKKLGASCDWQRERFTMDEEYSTAVREVFVRLFEKGLIYQGTRIINWCPRCHTALSDEEAAHKEMQGNLYFLRYPVKGEDQGYLVVATTRPETMLGDTAVAVNPKDRRYKKFIGKTLLLPLTGREIRVIADEMVDVKFGTGCVKITPAHDPNDYLTGKKHGLEFINVMHPDGRMNESAGRYAGLDRFRAREAVLEDLKNLGLLDKVEPHALSAGHCYRCNTIVEPYLSKQWFVRMQPLAKPAIDAVRKGRVKFHPSRWSKVYLNWMENIQDWCISRQIWWGHRIPVYYCDACLEAGREGVIVASLAPKQCPACGSGQLRQDEDVLDTWFSSWLWPFATFYWPFRSGDPARNARGTADLNYFYPTSALVTAQEIIFFWVARMMMAGFEFMGREPFRDVYIHGTVRDAEGKKMSKSLGNVIDPLEIVEEYGADALRFSLVAITAQGQDVYLARERFEQGRNFANKIWNASRFVLMNFNDAPAVEDMAAFAKAHDLGLTGTWILSRYQHTVREVTRDLAAFKFNEAANALYAFFWHEFCDWYLELIKQDIARPQVQALLRYILEGFLRLLHPFMPFISEEIWQKLKQRGAIGRTAGISIMTEPWPVYIAKLHDKKAEEGMALLQAVAQEIRVIRQDLDIPHTQELSLTASVAEDTLREHFAAWAGMIKPLCRVSSLEVNAHFVKQPGCVSAVAGPVHLSISLQGVVDVQKEKIKLAQRMKETVGAIAGKEKMLSNEQFTARAPQEIVQKEKDKLRELQALLAKLKVVHDGL